MRISAGSAGTLATDLPDVLCFYFCVWYFCRAHHSAAARSFVHAHVLSLSGSTLDDAQLKFTPTQIRTERIHRMVADGWATRYQISFFFFTTTGTTKTPLLSRHIIIIITIIITTLFHYFIFKSQATSSFVFQIINNKLSDFGRLNLEL